MDKHIAEMFTEGYVEFLPDTDTPIFLATGWKAQRVFWSEKRDILKISGDLGSHLPPHKHPMSERIYVASGSALVIIKGIERHITKGDAIEVAAGYTHEIIVTSECAELLVTHEPPITLKRR